MRVSSSLYFLGVATALANRTQDSLDGWRTKQQCFNDQTNFGTTACTDIYRPILAHRTMPAMCYPESHACDTEMNNRFLQLWNSHATCFFCQVSDLVDTAAKVVNHLFEATLRMRFLDTPKEEGICPHAALLALYVIGDRNMYEFDVNAAGHIKFLSAVVRNFYEECGKREINNFFFQNLVVSLEQLNYVAMMQMFGYEAITVGVQVNTTQLAELNRAEPINLRGHPIQGGFEVLDIGPNFGIDSAYYLKRGYRTVAVDGNKLAVDVNYRNFGSPLRYGYFKLYYRVLMPHGASQGYVRFCNKKKSEHSYLMCDNATKAIPCVHPEQQFCNDGYMKKVAAVTCGDFLEDIGLPSLYLKIDIEGQTFDCVRALGRVRVKYPQIPLPKYVSMEVGNYPTAFKMMHLLTDAGYTRFKVVDQKWFCPKLKKFLRTIHFLGAQMPP